MEKRIIVALIFIAMVTFVFAGTPRVYIQKLTLDDNSMPAITNPGTETSSDYILTADIIETPGEVVTTQNPAPDGYTYKDATQLKVFRSGNGTSVPYYSATFLQLGTFNTQWLPGNTIDMTVTHIASGETANWTFVIPEGTNVINIQEPTQVIPPYSPATFTLAVGANYPGAAIYLDGADTGQVTPFTFDPADAGTYTVVLPNVEWTPAEYVYTAEADETANFVGVLNPAVPTITFPEEAQVFTWEAAQAVTITWENGAIIPDYYECNWNGGDWLALAAGVTEWTTPELEEGAYNFQVRGVIEDPTLGSKTFTKARFTTRNVSNSPKGTGAVATVNFSVVITPAADIPEDTPTPVGDATVTISGGSANYDMSGDIPPIPNGSIVIADQFVLQLIGAGPWTITIQTTAPWASYYSGGMWYAVENSGGFITFTVTASKDMDLPVVLADLDPTLPVELSAFNAVLTAQYFVKLTWISESETGLLGYRVYRSEDNVYDNAVSITPIMIDATNTSSTHVYTHEDREVMNNTGYYYWLEAVDMTHSTPYGPQYVEVKHDETPELPAQTVLKSAYPNPFKANSNTNIPVEVKAGESGTVTIYNVLGQVVKTFNVNEGFNPLTWNGRDSRNNACGSGIYFYKLSTPSKNQTKKMVIVK